VSDDVDSAITCLLNGHRVEFQTQRLLGAQDSTDSVRVVPDVAAQVQEDLGSMCPKMVKLCSQAFLHHIPIDMVQVAAKEGQHA
jgi:hypothetical protein